MKNPVAEKSTPNCKFLGPKMEIGQVSDRRSPPIFRIVFLSGFSNHGGDHSKKSSKNTKTELATLHQGLS